MIRAALWQKHRPVALGVAQDWRIPGLDPDDVRQEALVALWEATAVYDKMRGTFPAFARLVIKRHLCDLLRAATARARRPAHVITPLDVDPEDRSVRDRIAARIELVEIARRLPALTERERQAVRDHLNGLPVKSSKAHETALTRARRKLAA